MTSLTSLAHLDLLIASLTSSFASSSMELNRTPFSVSVTTFLASFQVFVALRPIIPRYTDSHTLCLLSPTRKTNSESSFSPFLMNEHNSLSWIFWTLSLVLGAWSSLKRALGPQIKASSANIWDPSICCKQSRWQDLKHLTFYLCVRQKFNIIPKPMPYKLK